MLTPLNEQKLFKKAASGKSTEVEIVVISFMTHLYCRWELIPLFSKWTVHHQDSAAQGGQNLSQDAACLLQGRVPSFARLFHS